MGANWEYSCTQVPIKAWEGPLVSENSWGGSSETRDVLHINSHAVKASYHKSRMGQKVFSVILSGQHSTLYRASSERPESQECPPSQSCEGRSFSEERQWSSTTAFTGEYHYFGDLSSLLFNLEAGRVASFVTHPSWNTSKCRDHFSGSRCCQMRKSACQLSTPEMFISDKDEIWNSAQVRIWSTFLPWRDFWFLHQNQFTLLLWCCPNWIWIEWSFVIRWDSQFVKVPGCWWDSYNSPPGNFLTVREGENFAAHSLLFFHWWRLCSYHQ